MIIPYVVSGAKSIWLISKAAPVEMHKWSFFILGVLVGMPLNIYKIYLLTQTDIVSLFTRSTQFYFDIALVLLPPYFALTNVTSVGGTDSTSCQKKKNVPPRPQSTRT